MRVLMKENAVRTVVIVVFLALCACIPLTQAIDHSIDRKRAMYDDLAVMQWLQYQEVVNTGSAIPLRLSNDRSMSVAGTEFTPAAGVTVVVRSSEPDTYCVRATNDDGDATRWACLDKENPPANPGTVEAIR